MLSLSTAKSGALIGVLISVTTIPAAANIGVAAAYQDWDELAREHRRSWRSTSARSSLAGTAVLCRPARASTSAAGAPSTARPGAPGRRPAGYTDEPSDDQISTFVLIFSTTASVNSVVVAWPPRSKVFTPPAVVSSVAS